MTDNKKALEKLVSLDHPEAELLLGYLHEHGLYCEKNLDGAEEWYRKAIGSGSKLAIFFLARVLEAKGGEETLRESFELAGRAFDSGIVEAELLLAGQYENGHGVEQDLKKAKELYASAAEKGNIEAAEYLAAVYSLGVWGDPDPEQSMYWNKYAAKIGGASGAYELGRLHEHGEGGVAKSDKDALRWYEIAVRRGSVNAASRLMFVYGHGGLGVKPNTEKAKYYATKMETLADETFGGLLEDDSPNN